MVLVKIYHNPKCSKSCEALDYLITNGYQPEIINYLETPPSLDEVRQLVRQLGIAPSSLIRAPDFTRLGLTPTSDGEQLMGLIVEYPVLLQRPIVIVGDKARIAKPVDVLRDLLPGLK